MTYVVGAWISPLRLYWSYGPLDVVEVQPVPWWLYIGMAIGLMGAGAIISLLVLPYRNIQTGKTFPSTTVDRLIAVKDNEIAHLLEEVTHWRGYGQIKDSAYVELAGSIDEITDALRELVDGLVRIGATGTGQQQQPPSRTTNTEAPNNARQRQRRDTT